VLSSETKKKRVVEAVAEVIALSATKGSKYSS
jgi:hypothetical protein